MVSIQTYFLMFLLGSFWPQQGRRRRRWISWVYAQPAVIPAGPLHYAEDCVCTESGSWAEPIDGPVLCTQGSSRLQNSFPEESGRNSRPWLKKLCQEVWTGYAHRGAVRIAGPAVPGRGHSWSHTGGFCSDSPGPSLQRGMFQLSGAFCPNGLESAHTP